MSYFYFYFNKVELNYHIFNIFTILILQELNIDYKIFIF